MLKKYNVLTLTHHAASLDLVGKVVVDPSEIAGVMRALKAHFGWEEALYLSTCNRVSFCFYGSVPESGEDMANVVLSIARPDLSGADRQIAAGKMRLWQGADAVRHWLEVAASMDSLVLGEREILRQMREAYDRCRRCGLTGDHLRLLMTFTVETAKAVYTETGIGEKALSVVALAMQELLKAKVPASARIVLVGAGQTNALFTKLLKKAGFQNFVIFNRTIDKAVELAQQTGGQAFPLSEIFHYTAGFDVLAVCTGATEPVVTPDIYQHLLQGETSPKMVIDLSIPNNVHAAVVGQFSMQYIAIEDLRDTARENMAHREQERQKAVLLLNEKIHVFRDLWHQRQVERSLLPMVDQIKAVKRRALDEVFRSQVEGLDEPSRQLLEEMLVYMEKKCVAIPMRIMKETAAKHLASAGKG